jgi:hypothetical protein
MARLHAPWRNPGRCSWAAKAPDCAIAQERPKRVSRASSTRYGLHPGYKRYKRRENQETSGPKAGARRTATSAWPRAGRGASPSTQAQALASDISAQSTAWLSLWPPRTDR